MGEGAGVVVLEEFEHAKSARRADLRRGHRLRPVRRRLPHHRAGRGRRRRLPRHADGAEARRARRRTRSTTSTPTAPRRRSATRSSWAPSKRLFGDAATRSRMSSTKSAIGHLLGAAGASRRSSRILAIRDQVVPPTLNLDNPSDGCRRSTWCRTRPSSGRSTSALSNSLRLRRHQRQPGLHAAALTFRTRRRASPDSSRRLVLVATLVARSRRECSPGAGDGCHGPRPAGRGQDRRHRARRRRRAHRRTAGRAGVDRRSLASSARQSGCCAGAAAAGRRIPVPSPGLASRQALEQMLRRARSCSAGSPCPRADQRPGGGRCCERNDRAGGRRSAARAGGRRLLPETYQISAGDDRATS